MSHQRFFRSVVDSVPANVIGTAVLLQAARRFWENRSWFSGMRQRIDVGSADLMVSGVSVFEHRAFQLVTKPLGNA